MERQTIHEPESNWQITRTTVKTEAGNQVSYSFDGVTNPDVTAMDTLADELMELASEGGGNVEAAITELVNKQRREIFSEVLLKIILILAESKDIRSDIELIVACSGLNLRNQSDSQIADSLNMSRQTFSARKRQMLKKLALTAPAHGKTLTAREKYRLGNATKINLN